MQLYYISNGVISSIINSYKINNEKALKCKSSAEFCGNIGNGLKTPFHAYVLGEHTSMTSVVYSRPIFKVRGLSIEPHFSTVCIGLSMHCTYM